jgi:hypothetical protein
MRTLPILLLLTGCAGSGTLAVRQYDAGVFLVSYKAPAQVDPVFTHISRSLADRDDGAIYITADPPGGVLGTKPGRGFSIFLLPVDRFGLSKPGLAELAVSLPPKLRANHPSEVFSAEVRAIGSYQWCEVTSFDAASAESVTGVAYYAYADSDHLLYVGWSFPRPISKARFAQAEPTRLEILHGFEVTKRKPNQPPEPTRPSVTIPADAGLAPAARVAHL